MPVAKNEETEIEENEIRKDKKGMKRMDSQRRGQIASVYWYLVDTADSALNGLDDGVVPLAFAVDVMFETHAFVLASPDSDGDLATRSCGYGELGSDFFKMSLSVPLSPIPTGDVRADIARAVATSSTEENFA
ncbi:hypothetical protein GGU10DRAFT_331766 [Lentinula aff. detonsa]|uniref:Uncharacterized protein n=1 Tax=Lentinula aff. detonsa TaxID=2804958 RepID=A0AA38L053_9AGAR|nr:hypothetical protein GGU10DRAFT_331766 [Lentinula aff. detonsa]